MFNFLFLWFYFSSQGGWLDTLLGACRRIGWRREMKSLICQQYLYKYSQMTAIKPPACSGKWNYFQMSKAAQRLEWGGIQGTPEKTLLQISAVGANQSKAEVGSGVPGLCWSPYGHERSAWTLSCKAVKVSWATADSVRKKPKQSAYHGQLLCFIISKEAWGNRDHSIL